MVPARIRRWIEDVVPWFDRVAEARKAQRTEAIRQRSISARIEAERVILEGDRIRRAYRAYGDALDR